MAKTPNSAGPATKGLQIVSRPASFWRCGMQFTAQPRTVPLSELTADQVQRLKDETQLVVTEVDITPAKDA